MNCFRVLCNLWVAYLSFCWDPYFSLPIKVKLSLLNYSFGFCFYMYTLLFILWNWLGIWKCLCMSGNLLPKNYYLSSSSFYMPSETTRRFFEGLLFLIKMILSKNSFLVCSLLWESSTWPEYISFFLKCLCLISLCVLFRVLFVLFRMGRLV